MHVFRNDPVAPAVIVCWSLSTLRAEDRNWITDRAQLLGHSSFENHVINTNNFHPDGHSDYITLDC